MPVTSLRENLPDWQSIEIPGILLPIPMNLNLRRDISIGFFSRRLISAIRLIRRCGSLWLILAFLLNSFGPMPSARAGEVRLPNPGVMVHLSPEYNPAILKGIKIHPENPFRFDFILDTGDENTTDIKSESTQLIKYFLASLTIPEKDLWVNLSPYEKDRIIPNSFGLTEMGRDLLAEDYMLKQITASLIYPEDEIGKKFWKRIYEEAQSKYHTTNIPVNTFNKVWIVPEKAVVYENGKTGIAYVVESRLKVMLEEDYLAMSKNIVGATPRGRPDEGQAQGPSPTDTHQIGSQIIRDIVIPELTKEVNENQNFAKLRQVYNSLILATWYKKKIKDGILAQLYADKNKVVGINTDDPQEKEKIYQQYLQAFKKGVYNYIKEEMDPLTQQAIPRKYFSGGFGFAGRMDSAMVTVDHLVDPAILKSQGHEMLVATRFDQAMAGASTVDNFTITAKPLENGVTVLSGLAPRLLDDVLSSLGIARIQKDEQGQLSLVRKTTWAKFKTSFEIVDKFLNLKQSIIELARKRKFSSEPIVIADWGFGDGTTLKELWQWLKDNGITNVVLIGFANQYYPKWQSKWEGAPKGVFFVFDVADNFVQHFKDGPLAQYKIDLIYSNRGLDKLSRDELDEHLNSLKDLLKPAAEIRFTSTAQQAHDLFFDPLTGFALNTDYKVKGFVLTAKKDFAMVSLEAKRISDELIEVISAPSNRTPSSRMTSTIWTELSEKLKKLLLAGIEPGHEGQASLTLEDFTYIGSHLNEVWKEDRGESIFPYLSLLIDQFIDNSAHFYEFRDRVDALTKGGSLEDRGLALWVRGVMQVTHLRFSGLHAEKTKEGTLELFDNEDLIKVVRELIPLMVQWKKNYKASWDSKVPSITQRNGEALDISYGQLMQWGLMGMLDPIVHNVDYFFQPGKYSEKTKELVAANGWSGQDSMKYYMTKMLTNLGVNDQDVSDLLTETFLNLSKDGAYKKLRSPISVMTANWSYMFPIFLKGSALPVSEVFFSVLPKEDMSYYLLMAQNEDEGHHLGFQIFPDGVQDDSGGGHLGPANSPYNHLDTVSDADLLDQYAKVFDVIEEGRFLLVARTIREVATNIASSEVDDSAMMATPQWPKQVPQSSEALDKAIKETLPALEKVLATIKSGEKGQGKIQIDAISSVTVQLHALTGKDRVLFSKAVAQAQKKLGNPNASWNFVNWFSYFRTVLFYLNISLFVKHGWVFDLSYNHAQGTIISREKIQNFELLEADHQPIAIIQVKDMDETIPGQAIMTDQHGIFINPGYVFLRKLTDEEINKQYDVLIESDNEDTRRVIPSIVPIWKRVNSITRERYRELYPDFVLEEEWTHLQDYNNSQKRSKEGSKNQISKDHVNGLIDNAFPKESKHPVIRLIRDVLKEQVSLREERKLGFARFQYMILEASIAARRLLFAPSVDHLIISLASEVGNSFTEKDEHGFASKIVLYAMGKILRGEYPQDINTNQIINSTELHYIAQIEPEELYARLKALADQAMTTVGVEVEELTWKDLEEKEGYSLDIKKTNNKDGTTHVQVFLKQRGNLISSIMHFEVFEDQKILFVSRFYPSFPQERKGRGRALLKEIFKRLGYKGFSVLSLASNELQSSLSKMSEYDFKLAIEPLMQEDDSVLSNGVKELFTKISMLNDSQTKPSVRKKLMQYLEETNVLGKTPNNVSDTAMVGKTPGGINFNPANLNLQIKHDGNGIPLPFAQQSIQNIRIDGLTPVIINITPVTDLPELLGLNTSEEPMQLSRAQ